MPKHKLTLSVNEDLVKRAREHGINISAFLEIKLQEHLALLHGKRYNRKDKWTGRDLNPRPPPCEGNDLPTDLPAHEIIDKVKEKRIIMPF